MTKTPVLNLAFCPNSLNGTTHVPVQTKLCGKDLTKEAPEICVLGDSKPSQARREDLPSQIFCAKLKFSLRYFIALSFMFRFATNLKLIFVNEMDQE